MTDPDIAGFAEAQATLRAKFGRPVPFFTPIPTVWPTDVPADAQGVPLDPTVAPLASGYSTVVASASIASRPVQGNLAPAAEDGPIGIVDARDLLLIMEPADFEQVEGATECEIFRARYKITDTKPDQLGGEDVQRYLIFTEKM
jgi:hypothetical protein